MKVLEAGLKGSELRHQAISQNIANVDTPNYKSKSVQFKQALDEEMSKTVASYRTNEKHLEFSSSQKGSGGSHKESYEL